MKKTYMKPETLSVSIQMAAMIAASDSVTSDQLDGVTYGGIDDGTNDPSSRDSFWGDEVW
jgi:hypothetical protein